MQARQCFQRAVAILYLNINQERTRVFDIKVANIKAQYNNTETRADQGAHGGKHGKEHRHSLATLAHRVNQNIYGQYDRIILDMQPCQTMGSFFLKPRQENSRDFQ